MRAVYKNNDNSICVVIPTKEALSKHSIETIALKDVPTGVPFWLVENSEIPTDRTFRDAWEIPEEWGEPDGYGSQYNTFEELEELETEVEVLDAEN